MLNNQQTWDMNFSDIEDMMKACSEYYALVQPIFLTKWLLSLSWVVAVHGKGCVGFYDEYQLIQRVKGKEYPQI